VERAALGHVSFGGAEFGVGRVEQQTQRICQKVALLAFDLLARIIAMRIDAGPPFFSALHALAIDNGDSRAPFALALLEARWQVIRDRPPPGIPCSKYK
jgi:hypothetical protein